MIMADIIDSCKQSYFHLKLSCCKNAKLSISDQSSTLQCTGEESTTCRLVTPQGGSSLSRNKQHNNPS